jgi:ATP sulfurylase
MLTLFYAPLALKNFASVVDTLHLADGTLFPIPITLDISKEDIDRLGLAPGVRVALRDPRDDEALAIITGTLGFPHSLLKAEEVIPAVFQWTMYIRRTA